MFDFLKSKVKEKYSFPCENCLVLPCCSKAVQCEKLEWDNEKVKDLFLKYKRCPDCGSTELHEGPSAGSCTNVKCAGCGHWFNMGLPMFIERIHIPEFIANQKHKIEKISVHDMSYKNCDAV